MQNKHYTAKFVPRTRFFAFIGYVFEFCLDEFCWTEGTTAPFVQRSTSPTKSPSLRPTKHPTPKPTQNPSIYVSKTPTISEWKCLKEPKCVYPNLTISHQILNNTASISITQDDINITLPVFGSIEVSLKGEYTHQEHLRFILHSQNTSSETTKSIILADSQGEGLDHFDIGFSDAAINSNPNNLNVHGELYKPLEGTFSETFEDILAHQTWIMEIIDTSEYVTERFAPIRREHCKYTAKKYHADCFVVVPGLNIV